MANMSFGQLRITLSHFVPIIQTYALFDDKLTFAASPCLLIGFLGKGLTQMLLPTAHLEEEFLNKMYSDGAVSCAFKSREISH